MAQKTNLNVSPYFDDFNSDNNYYRVLFNPGRPVQSRELNTLQSILQDQIESFGSHIFKEGSVVIPGNVIYDSQFYAVKLNPTNFGIDISLYIESYIGKKIVGQISGTSAVLQYVVFPDGNDVEYVTLYVKYIDSDNNFEFNQFQDNEPLYSNDIVTYGNTTINSGETIASTISLESTSIASAVSVSDGIYFIRGTFVNVNKETLILDYYSNTPSYRIGFRVSEEIVTAKDDPSLYDNAKGFNNYAAPGADRFKISVFLDKKDLDDIDDTNFIELLRVQDGFIKKIENKTQYNFIRDYIAQRTYDESGNYIVNPFQVTVNNSLNDRLGNDGLFFAEERTFENNDPNDDLMCVKISPGKAYVKGYDIEKNETSIIDVQKPRDVSKIERTNVPFEMGNLIRVNNVTGGAYLKSSIELYNKRKTSNSTIPTGSTQIGQAIVYNFNLTDSAYNNNSTSWDLYLFDVQTYTVITVNEPLSSTDLNISSYIKGKSSNSSAYSVFAGDGTGTNITLRQTSGTFLKGEEVIIDGDAALTRIITNVVTYTIEDVKSVYQNGDGTTKFIADTVLDFEPLIGFNSTDQILIKDTTGEVTSFGKLFSNLKVGSVIKYTNQANPSLPTYNQIKSIASDGSSIELESIQSITNVNFGDLPSGSDIKVSALVGKTKFKNTNLGSLYAKLPNSNISSVDLSNSSLIFAAQTINSSNPVVNGDEIKLTLSLSDFGVSNCQFASFDEERYSIHYSDGTIQKLEPNNFSYVSGSQITFFGLSNKPIKFVNATFIKLNIQSKNKIFNRCSILNIDKSKYKVSGTGINQSINDGLTYNKFYGLRIQDEEISLNVPDVVNVLKVYESLDTDNPVMDQLTFTLAANVFGNSIIGENIIGTTSGCVAKVVSKIPGFPNNLNVVYLNSSRFGQNEVVKFEESNIETEIVSIIDGKYKDITDKFTLDYGQKEQYYDYSKLVRNKNQAEPTKRLMVIFDNYTSPSNDNGDLYTVLSYDKIRFSNDIPNIGSKLTKLTDVLDFRPRVSPFNSTTSSPFDLISRNFNNEPKLILTPNEGCLLGYDYYVPRIDKVYLDKYGNLIVEKGISSSNPKPPVRSDDTMELATIYLPAYLYNPKDAVVSLSDNKRYTMKDIGKIEDRVENLEKVTSLSLLELNTQTLQIQDAQGFNRFRTGFFVDDFKNKNLINLNLSLLDINTDLNELTPVISKNTLKNQLISSQDLSDDVIDYSDNFELLDPNVQKTGDLITLKYKEIEWIKQPLATKVENVNPFHVVEYIGTVKLNPQSDTWVRTIIVFDNAIVPEEQYMRSRNTEFFATRLKPLTRYYQFLDGNGSVNFVPKLIEIATDQTLQNYGASKNFIIGERVNGYFNNKKIINFRVAQPNHKSGNFKSPDLTYNINPYLKTESLPTAYSASSKVLNVDTFSLSNESQGSYSGYLEIGTKLIGTVSGAIAYVKDLRLISDNYGDLVGTFYLKDPYANPSTPVRISTGNKIYLLTSSPSNQTPAPGSKLISTAQVNYPTQETRNIVRINTTRRRDPLAQSFSVGTNSQSPLSDEFNDDINGAFLSSVDLYFSSKDSGSSPVTVELRTMELGVPTLTVIGNPITLRPEEVFTSPDASIPTKFTFDYPIYLQPGNEYAIVILAPESTEYEVWIAEMGQKTVGTSNLPDAESIRYTRQFAIGSLFKSQNGSIWTANQYQDLKFKLHKCNFTSETGTVFFSNPVLDTSNGFIKNLLPNSITSYPKKLKVKTNLITDPSLVGILTSGRKVSTSSQVISNSYGYIEKTGSAVNTVGLTTGGSNYVTSSNVNTYNITGNGTGLTLNITADPSGYITDAVPSSTGSGYSVGDVVGIVTSSTSSKTGYGSLISITSINNSIDTLYLTSVQGKWIVGSGSFSSSNLVYYSNTGSIVSLASTSAIDCSELGNPYKGNFIRVQHSNHGMYSANNKVIINDVESTIAPLQLNSSLLITESSIISVANTASFATFEGIPVSVNNPGYVKIDNEIIRYESVVGDTLQTLQRGIDSTPISDHSVGSLVYKYELNGISLRRINKEHTISPFDIGIDYYHIEIDREGESFPGVFPLKPLNTNRTIDRTNLNGDPEYSPELSFNLESNVGGDKILASENIIFTNVNPTFEFSTPGSVTEINARVRTVSGTSASGSEVSFNDIGYEEVQLNKDNKLSSVRLVCSKANESQYLTSLPRSKSFTTALGFSTKDKNLSPSVFIDNCFTEFSCARIHRPITDYVNDNRVNSISNDPHSLIYVSNTVNLAQPATTLKIIISAYRDNSADFRVLYNLIRPDSSDVEQSFELFPGYDNLTTDNNLDGFLDIVDPSKNSGLPDTFVPPSLNNQFLDYEFTASNLGLFIGYTIKIVASGTNQALYPRFKDLRSIAIR